MPNTAEMKEQWKQTAINNMKKQAKTMINMRLNSIESQFLQLLPNFKIPNKNNFIKIRLDLMYNQFDKWSGVDEKPRTQRKNLKNKKKKKNEQKDESWYNKVSKNWFNQRVWYDDFFGGFWLDIFQYIKSFCGNNRVLFYQSVHKLLEARIDFGKKTKAQPLLQSSIIYKNSKLNEFLLNNGIGDIDRIKKMHLQRYRKKINAKGLRLEVIFLLNKLILNPNINVSNINELSQDINNHINEIDIGRNSVTLTHSMPYQARNYRYNPLDIHPTMDDVMYNNDYDLERNKVIRQNRKLKQMIAKLKQEKIDLQTEIDQLKNRNILQQQNAPLPPSTNIFNNSPFPLYKNHDHGFSSMPPTVDDNNTIMNYNQLPMMSTMNKDNLSVSTNSTINEFNIKNDDVNGPKFADFNQNNNNYGHYNGY